LVNARNNFVVIIVFIVDFFCSVPFKTPKKFGFPQAQLILPACKQVSKNLATGQKKKLIFLQALSV
jgi:hypothetical protein